MMLAVARLIFIVCAASARVLCDDGVCQQVYDDEAAEDRQLFQSRLSIGHTQKATKQKKAVTQDAEARPKIKVGIVDHLFGDSESSVRQSKDNTLCEEDVFAHPELCPKHCPFAAEMADRFCHFRCVRAKECGLLQTVPNATIPDEKMHACRHCEVEACATCVAGKPGQTGKDLERCLKCMPGYSVTEEGECAMKGLWVFVIITLVVAVIVVILTAWYLRVLMRPRTNQEGVDYGVASRSRAMVLQKNEARSPYPLRTNLLSTNVAGAGTMCFFRFQFALLVWAITLLAVWLGFAHFVSADLLILGTQPATTPQRLCAVVRWGRTRQMQLLWTKVAWLVFAYVFSFVCSVLYAIQQTKIAAEVDATNTSMSDFATVLRGLPPMRGADNVEAVIKEAVENATGEQVVGVSVGWVYDSCMGLIEETIEKQLCPDDDHGRSSASRLGHTHQQRNLGCLARSPAFRSRASCLGGGNEAAFDGPRKCPRGVCHL